jgi:hypothetical protein
VDAALRELEELTNPGDSQPPFPAEDVEDTDGVIDRFDN